MTDVRCLIPSGDRLGEGPCWVAAENRLYWFDIKNRRLCWLSAETGRHGEWVLPVRASAAAARASGGLIVATEAGLAWVNTTTGDLTIIKPVTHDPGFRSNDGKIDVKGRFWWSLMDDNGGERPGAVYRTDSNGKTERVLDGIHIPNTLAVTADGATLYLADSKKGEMSAYPIDSHGRLGPPRSFFRLEDGAPDGSAMDAEGYLWNAQWGASRVVRYAPDGRIDRIVPMPVEQPTSCAFGGPGLSILYITSARDELSDEALVRQPLAGGLFAFEPGVKGLALPAFAS
jgi:sugar lactone lactonase YvrE